MRFELFVAARYLRAKRRQAVVGVVTAISVAGVAAGVAALIIAFAITNGMQRDLEGKLVDSTSHIQLMQTAGRGIRDWRPLFEKLRHLPHVTGASPAIWEQVLVSHNARSGGAMVEGIRPNDEMTVSTMLKNATPGSANQLAAEAAPVGDSQLPPLILGQDLAETIGAAVGDPVMLISPQGDLTPVGLEPKYVAYRLVGTYHSGFYEYDSQMGFLRLSDAQKLFDEPDLITVISFKVDDPNRAPEIAKEIEQAAGKEYMTTNWTDQNRALFTALKEEQVVTFIVISLIVEI